MINRSIFVMGLGMLVLTPITVKETKNLELSYFPIEVSKSKTKRFKITTYYIPTIIASDIQSDNFPHEIRVNKKGKEFNIYVKSSGGLYTEGYAKIETESKSFYLDYKWNYSDKPRTADGGVLNDGDLACNELPFGTKVEIKGKIYTIVDRGGGLGKNHIDLYTENYSKKTFYTDVKIINQLTEK
jgi:hypothetical protein